MSYNPASADNLNDLTPLARYGSIFTRASYYETRRAQPALICSL